LERLDAFPDQSSRQTAGQIVNRKS